MDGATTGKVQPHQHQFFVHQKEEQQVNCCLEEGRVLWGRWLLHFQGGWTLAESMSPVSAVGHEKQHFADPTEAIFQRGDGQEW